MIFAFARMSTYTITNRQYVFPGTACCLLPDTPLSVYQVVCIYLGSRHGPILLAKVTHN